MRNGCALVISLALCSAVGIAQGKLPDAEHTWIVGAKKMRQSNNHAPLTLVLSSGARIAVPPQDVHEYGTSIIRSAMMKQAKRSVPPALLFALHIRGTAPVGKSDVDVTLASGTVVRVRASDVNDARLTFLRTAMAEARSGPSHASQYASAMAKVDSALASVRSAPSEAAARSENECDTFQKADFDANPWLRQLVAHLKQFWYLPYAASAMQGCVRVKFVLHKDGRMTDVTVVEASSVEAFNKSAVFAVILANPAPPLPAEYPAPHVTICVAFYFNRTPRVENEGWR